MISFHPHQKHRPTKPLIRLKDNIIGYKTELKFLGLIVTETLTGKPTSNPFVQAYARPIT